MLSRRVLQLPLGCGYGEFAGDQAGEDEVAGGGGKRVVGSRQRLGVAMAVLMKVAPIPMRPTFDKAW